ncbi:MAG TPA: alpha/beta hydrolase-fold protein [Candidatus Xenobia bacterium]|jgi:esterase/lipase superfamily enzyme
MNKQSYTWHSPILDREMSLNTYGHAGQNYLVFPTSKGRYFDWEGFGGMVGALEHALANGWVQLTCVDSVDAESWYNYGAHPGYRAFRHQQYDRYISEEVVPFILSRTGNPFIAAAGCSFGGYHAANFGFRHPDQISKIVSMSGSLDITDNVVGYYDDNVYYNNPKDYIPGLDDPSILWRLRQQRQYFGLAPNEPFTGDHYFVVGKLHEKGVPAQLDVPHDAMHDWGFWRHYVNATL